MENLIKNLDHGVALPLAEQIHCLPGQIVSKTLAQTRHHSLTLFAFDQGEEIGSHESCGDALALALDGVGRITINGATHLLRPGEAIIMPARAPHAVYAQEPFKMLLTVLFPEIPPVLPNRADASPV